MRLSVFAVALVLTLVLSVSYAQAQQGPQFRKSYNFAEIATILIAAYAITYVLVRKKKIDVLTHRKLWNVALLVAFAVSGVLGLLLVIRINYGWAFLQHFLMLNLHVEAGIAMAIVSFFHLHMYWRFYKCVIKRGKKCDT